MTPEHKEEIRRRKAGNYVLMDQLRWKLKQELEELCVSYGGHEFYDWQDVSYYNAANEWIEEDARDCVYCNKREYRKGGE